MESKDFIALAMFGVTVAGILVAFGGILHSLRAVVKDVAEMETRVDGVDAKITAHQMDAGQHVNHLYMRAVEGRLDRLESAVEEGHKRIESKLDGLSKLIYDRK